MQERFQACLPPVGPYQFIFGYLLAGYAMFRFRSCCLSHAEEAEYFTVKVGRIRVGHLYGMLVP